MPRPIEHKYCEGKVKRTLKRGSKELEIVIRKRYIIVGLLLVVRLLRVWFLRSSGLLKAMRSRDQAFGG